MHFLQPIWLMAMAGIVLPVIVHFWNDRRGKVLRIGSVVLLEGASQRMSWSRRISQWWLLLLRCLLVMALALLLAGPYWVSRDGRKQGWVLVAPGAELVYGGQIDSLVKKGWTRRVLDGADHWAAFRAADRLAPADVAFTVFSPRLASGFVGPRPFTGRVVRWEVFSPADSVSEWTEKTWTVSADSVRVMKGVARRTGSVFQFVTMAGGVDADTTTLNITIYGASPDTRYLAAALKAVQEFTHRRMRVAVADGVAAIQGDWLFWLSSKPLDPAVAGRFGKVWQYGVGQEKKVDSWMEGGALYKEIEGTGEVVWADGFGRGVLTRAGNNFRFYSRLDPEWGELVWSRQFPAMLARLLFGEEGPGARDRRVLDVSQVAPVWKEGMASGVEDRSVPDRRGGVDLGPASWILIFLLFVLERWLSGKE